MFASGKQQCKEVKTNKYMVKIYLGDLLLVGDALGGALGDDLVLQVCVRLTHLLRSTADTFTNKYIQVKKLLFYMIFDS